MRLDFALCLPRDGSSIPFVRHLIRVTLERLEVEDDCVHDVELAVSEACTNVLVHALGPEDQYEVHIEIDDDRCKIRVLDGGAGFDHGSAWARDGGPIEEGGRGIVLMRALVDELQFSSRAESGTIVHLEKVLKIRPSLAPERT
jgi:serine/threonine-protein kinase RsbW